MSAPFTPQQQVGKFCKLLLSDNSSGGSNLYASGNCTGASLKYAVKDVEGGGMDDEADLPVETTTSWTWSVDKAVVTTAFAAALAAGNVYVYISFYGPGANATSLGTQAAPEI